MRRRPALALALAVMVACAAWAAHLPARAETPAATAAPYRIEPVAQGLEFPWSLAFLPDGRMLVTERAGRLRVIERSAAGDAVLRTAPVEGVPPVLAQGQAGMFDVLVDPDFAKNGWIYLSFAHGTPQANHLRVVRARFDGTRLHAVQPIFTTRPAKTHAQHFGARMAFLADGTLVVTMGDGNLERTEAQRLNTHRGKTLRINRDGSVPADNPYVGRQDALPEIYSSGHRNPQGLVFVAAAAQGGNGSDHNPSNHPAGRLYLHEHGSKGGDELNRIVPGANYGWPLTTGGIDYTGARITPYRTLPGITPPLLEWTPSIAPAGMAYYGGDRFPAWRGSLFVAALKEKSVRRVPMTGDVPGTQELLFIELGQRMRDVRAGPDGALYLLTDDKEGRVLRVVPLEGGS